MEGTEEHDKSILCFQCGILCKEDTEHVCEEVQIPADKVSRRQKDFLSDSDWSLLRRFPLIPDKGDRKMKEKKCPICGVNVDKSHWARHMETHQQQKRLKCEECQKSFSRCDALKRHLTSRIHGRKCNIVRIVKELRLPSKQPKGSTKELDEKHSAMRRQRAANQRRVLEAKTKFQEEWKSKSCEEPNCKVIGCTLHRDKYERRHIVQLGQEQRLRTCISNRQCRTKDETSNTEKQPVQQSDIAYGPEFKYGCEKCTKRFRYPSDLQAHIRGHAKDVHCRICRRTYKNRGSEIMVCTQCRQIHGTHFPTEQPTTASV